MSNSMKLIVRTLLIAVILVIGSWISMQLHHYVGGSSQFAWLPSAITVASYILAGITLGTMVSPRFTKKNRWVYLFPIVVFLIISMTPMLYYLAPFLNIPHYAVQVLSNCTALSWTMTGVFLSLAFQ